MADYGIAFASAVVFASSVLLARRSCYILRITRVSIASFWYLTYLAMIFFPSFVIYSNQYGLYRDRYLFAVESVLITVPLGWWFASWVWGFARPEIDVFYESPIVYETSERVFTRRVWVL